MKARLGGMNPIWVGITALTILLAVVLMSRSPWVEQSEDAMLGR